MRGLLAAGENGVPDEVQGWLPSSFPEPYQIGLAIAVMLIGWFLSKLAVRVLGRTVARKIERPSVTRTVLRGIRASVLLLASAIAAGILGVSGTEILLSVTVISAVIAVVLAPLVGSFINGFFVLADRPYEIGDMIEITDEGHTGFVENITIRYTKIFTLQNTFIVIPNSEIQQRDVINYSAEDERTRLSVEFEITYESDLDAARDAAERAARNVDSVISGGPAIRIGSARYGAAPVCTVLEYADNGIILELRFWVQRPYKRALARSAVQSAIRDRYSDLDVEFAYPHRHHVFDDTSGVSHLGLDGSRPARQSPHSSAEPGVEPSARDDE
ncbi:mechanosensitive ion channel family protein [Salinadaptatus halalkaliphilus]|uniref:Mechanosensitive ion channel family protein n=1 Tax=Salinadaptatus halalkaliphilus TaxID=2419781 RepID=A0A4S3TKX8_9EURY|nr:mechanosensitive ion channel family protein [Salinadaptatus halalkaliphilus]THE64804.1 mechanosensitive ion channel family protein [Salinadaptatus halalkaliphilus]